MKKIIANFFDFGFSLKELLIVLPGALLFVLSMPPHGYFILAFFCLIPLLIVLKGKSILISFRLGIIFGFISYALSLFWLYFIFKLSALSLYCVLAIFIGIFAVFFSLIQKIYNYKVALIFSPIIWMAVEFFKSEQWKLKFGWVSLGYSQYNNKYFLMMAKYIGVYGVSAVIVSISVLMLLLLKYREIKNRAIICLVLCSIAVFSLYANKKDVVLNDKPVAFRLVQAENDFDRSLNLALKNPIKKNSVIVFPEYSVYDSPIQNIALKRKILEFIEKSGCYFIFGCVEFVDPKNRDGLFDNIALLFSPTGEIVGKYRKHHPIQFFKDGRRGVGYPAFKTPIGTLGIGICYDFTYEDVSRNLVKHGAEVLINPAFDSLGWGRTQHIQHSKMIPFRAVETGRFVVRPTLSGISMVVNPRGEVLETIETGKEGVIDCEVPLLNNKTFYVNYGYLLPYLSQIMCILIIIIGIKYRSLINWIFTHV